jgi:hypothetical protein
MNKLDIDVLNKYGDSEIKKFIEGLESNKKRLAVLSLIVDNKDWINIKNIIENVNNPIYRMVALHNYIYQYYTPVDISDSSTPTHVVNQMLDEIPIYMWKNPFLKWLYPTNGRGSFPIHCIKRIMDRLKNWETDIDKLYKHINEKMIYVSDSSMVNSFLYQFTIDPYDELKLNIHNGNFLSNEMYDVLGINYYDISISNPPYNKKYIGSKCSAKPIYHKFVIRTINISRFSMFLTPSKWFAGGRGLNSFRNSMIMSKKIKLIKHYDKSSEFLGGGYKDIKGGISYFIYDNDYNGDVLFNNTIRDLSKYDIVTTNDNKKLFDIIAKSDDFINKICLGRGDVVFGIETNDNRLTDDGGRDKIICHVSTFKGNIKYIDKSLIIKNRDKIKKYKVITPRAATKGGCGFGSIKVLSPNEIANGSYLIFEVNSEMEAKSLASYLKTNIVNEILSMRKNSQDIKRETVSWIPLVPLDREWTNTELERYLISN